MYIFIPCRKHLQSFKIIEAKLYEELRPQGTHCLYTLIAFHVKKIKDLSSKKQKKWEK